MARHLVSDIVHLLYVTRSDTVIEDIATHVKSYIIILIYVVYLTQWLETQLYL